MPLSALNCYTVVFHKNMLFLLTCNELESESESPSAVSSSLRPMNSSPPGSSVWDSPGKNTGVGSAQFSHSVVSDSLRPHEPQHTRSPCPSPTPKVHPNPCPLSQWCHPTISFSIVPFSCLQCFPASGSFQMSQFFASGG